MSGIQWNEPFQLTRILSVQGNQSNRYIEQGINSNNLLFNDMLTNEENN